MNSEAKTSFSAENHRSVTKFLMLEGKSMAGIHRRLVKSLGREAFSETNVRYWYNRFKNGNWSVQDHRGGDFTSEPQAEVRVATIEEAFHQSRAWSLRALSAQYEIPYGTCHRIVTQNLKMKQKFKKWIPHDLTPAQVEVRRVYSQNNLQTFNDKKTDWSIPLPLIALCRPPERDQAKEWL